MRFRVLLPLLLLVLSITLGKIGNSQRHSLVHSVISKHSFMEHPLPGYYAVATYVDYGLNAPAWLLSIKTPFLFPSNADLSCCGFIETEKDWHYLILVVAMWFLIGMLLDKKDIERTSSWLRIVIRGLCGLYGIFLCYSALEYYLLPWNYPRWFVVPMALWGATLIFGSIYPFSVTRKKTWYRVISVFIVLSAIFDVEAGIRLYRFRTSFGIWTVTFLFSWGVILIFCSLYLFKLSKLPAGQSTEEKRS